MRGSNALLIASLSLSTLFVYQNCGSGFEASKVSEKLSSFSCTPNDPQCFVEPDPDPDPEPDAPRTIYVSPTGDDTHSGLTIDKPLKTPQAAQNRTLPGDTVLFMAGTYENTVGEDKNVMIITRSGTFDKWISYKPYPGHSVKFKANEKVAIFVYGSSYILIEGIELEGNRASITQAYAEANSNNPSNPLLANRGVYVGDNPIKKAISHHVVIQKLNVHDFSGGGINANWSDYITIQDNVVYRTAFWHPGNESAISIFEASDFDQNNSDYRIIIRRNIVYDNECKIPFFRINPPRITDGHGIIIDDSMHGQSANFPDKPSAPYTGRFLVANNLVYNNGAAGIYAFQSKNVDFFFNTSYHNVKTPSMQSYENEAYAHKSSDVRFMYNIVVPRSNRSPNTSLSVSQSTNITFNYNLYFGGLAPAIRGVNDIIGDPLFTNVTQFNFKPANNSPAINKAIYPAIADDIVGMNRPLGAASDLGAYETR